MRIRPHHAPAHRKRLHLHIYTILADLHITIRIERHHRTVDLPLCTRRHLNIPELPHTPHLRTTLKQPDRQCISKSSPLQPQPNNNPSQCQCYHAPPKAPLLFQKKPDTPHAKITLHPEQHKRHRKQRQCHKQVKPTPSHKRKPHNPQDPYLCHCRPTISKILVNENAPNRHLAPKIQKFARILYNPTDYSKIRATNSSLSPTPTGHEQSPRNSLSRTRRPPLTFWYSAEA